MFSLREPSPSILQNRLEAAAGLPLSYAHQLNTQHGPSESTVPQGYRMDHTRSQIGVGESAFQRAKGAMKRWQHFDLGWVRVANPAAQITPGELVAVQAHAMGLWSINISRILYVTDSTDDPNRFGYGYGTTPMHVERGEERFLLEYDPASGYVFYDLLAISQPAHWLAWLGYPYTRSRQHKFATESHRRMRQLSQLPVELPSLLS